MDEYTTVTGDSRIRRSSQLPREVDWKSNGLARSVEVPVTLASLGDLDCVIRSSGWSKRYEEEEVSVRSSLCKLRKGRSVVGFLEFKEYDLFGLHPAAAFDAMDAISQSACHCAELLMAQFDVQTFFDVFEDGNLLECATAWRHPDFPESSVWSDVLIHLVENYFQPAVALLKAFPLEYEGSGPATPYDVPREYNPYEVSQQRRVKAMMRMYQRRLGFVPAPAPFDDDGWMMKVTDRLIHTLERLGLGRDECLRSEAQ